MIAQASQLGFAHIGQSLFFSMHCILDYLHCDRFMVAILFSSSGIAALTNALFFWALLLETRGIPLEGKYFQVMNYIAIIGS